MKDKSLYRAPYVVYAKTGCKETREMILARLEEQGKTGCCFRAEITKRLETGGDVQRLEQITRNWCSLLNQPICYLGRASRRHPKVYSRIDCEVYATALELLSEWLPEDSLEEWLLSLE